MKTTDPKKRALLDGLKDGLIVSCQVQKDDPIYTDDIVVKMAEAAKDVYKRQAISYVRTLRSYRLRYMEISNAESH